MQAARDTVYSFKARWFDPQAQLNRHYNVRYFVQSHNVELFDTKTSRLFLKKSECPASLSAKDFFLGTKVLLYGRHFELQEYLDPFTAEHLGRQQQKTVLVLQGDMLAHVGVVLDALERRQLAVSALKMLQLARPQAEKLLALQSSSTTTDVEVTVRRLTDSPVVAMELVGENCVEQLQHEVRQLIARLHAQSDEISSAASEEKAQQLRRFFFETPHGITATLANCTCCVVLPHVLKEGMAGQVLAAIQQDATVRVSAMELFTLDRTTAAEFLEVYEGVVPHFNEVVDHLTTGPCLALELVGQQTEDVVAQFRRRAGPWDVEMAKELQPQTLRAKYGHDRVRNAVHCTDLTEDGVLECQYFFDILSRRQQRS